MHLAPIADVSVRLSIKSRQPLPHDVGTGKRDEYHPDRGDAANQPQPRPAQPGAVIRIAAAATPAVASADRYRRRLVTTSLVVDRSSWCVSRHNYQLVCHPERSRRIPTVSTLRNRPFPQCDAAPGGSVCITKSRAAPGTPYSYGP